MKRKSGLSRTTLLTRKSRIKPASKKRAAALKIYYSLRKEYLRLHPACEICNVKSSQDIHHKAGRGPNLNNTDTWMALCRLCHDDCHSNPSWAREQGYIT